jgi:probable rRNA maturation factor
LAVRKVLSSENVSKAGEITVCFLNDRQIRELNLMYRGCDTPTDVISFDNSIKKETILGDIAVSVDTAIRNARIYKTTPLYELYLYVAHGVLHLLGYDDKNNKDILVIQKKQALLLETLTHLLKPNTVDK